MVVSEFLNDGCYERVLRVRQTNRAKRQEAAPQRGAFQGLSSSIA